MVLMIKNRMTDLAWAMETLPGSSGMQLSWSAGMNIWMAS